MSADTDKSMSFWSHIDVLRGTLVHITVVVLVGTIVAFVFKEPLFRIIFAPKESDFISNQLLEEFSNWITQGAGGLEPVQPVQIINTGLAQQFVLHFKTAFCAGIVGASPYIIYQLFCFIAPALYEQERKYAIKVAGSGYVMFVLGLLLNYFPTISSTDSKLSSASKRSLLQTSTLSIMPTRTTSLSMPARSRSAAGISVLPCLSTSQLAALAMKYRFVLR